MTSTLNPSAASSGAARCVSYLLVGRDSGDARRIGADGASLVVDVAFDEFARQLRFACEGRAAGFLAGRILWEEAIAIADAGARRHWLRTVAADRLRRLAAIVGTHGRPRWAGRTVP